MANQILTFYGVSFLDPAEITVTIDGNQVFEGIVPADPFGTELFQYSVDGEIPKPFPLSFDVKTGHTVMIDAFTDSAPKELNPIYSEKDWDLLKDHYDEYAFFEVVMPLYIEKSNPPLTQEDIFDLGDVDYLNQTYYRRYWQILLEHGVAWYPNTDVDLCWFFYRK